MSWYFSTISLTYGVRSSGFIICIILSSILNRLLTMNNQSAIAVCAGAVQVDCIRNRPCTILWFQPGIPCIKCPAQFCVLFRLQLYSRMIALWARCILGAAIFAANAAAYTATTGKAALFIPLVIAASLFQYIRFVRFRQPAFCGRFARRAGPHKTQSENPAAGR